MEGAAQLVRRRACAVAALRRTREPRRDASDPAGIRISSAGQRAEQAAVAFDGTNPLGLGPHVLIEAKDVLWVPGLLEQHESLVLFGAVD